MNRYKLSKAGVSANEGIKRFSGNTEKYEELLCQFPEDTHYKAMCSAIENGNAEAAFNAAHALKGMAGNLSMNRLYEDICPLVEVLRSGSLLKADELLKAIQEDYYEIIMALGCVQ